MPAPQDSAAPKPATEQPGNSFRYLYWCLSEQEFQQLCAALLQRKFTAVRCFPAGMADEGIDAVAEGSIIFQVKWTSKFQQDPTAWLARTITAERPKIARLVKQKRITRYIVMTSVAGTTAARGTGSIQKLQKQLDRYSAELGIPVECWWQSDIDALVNAAPDSVKWSYQEMLAGADAIRYLIHGSATAGQAARMRDTVLQVMATQWREDAKIKFSQVDMDRVNVADVFVNVHVSVQHTPPLTPIPDVRLGAGGRTSPEPLEAAAYLLDPAHPLIFLLGVPGQGKSTLGQYLSQIHRAAILPDDITGDRLALARKAAGPRLPLRVDLTDYASWLSGQDPFGDEAPRTPGRPRRKSQRSLELFLADFCSAFSSSRQVSVEDVQSLLARYPALLVLDGLDEVPDPALRSIVVEEISVAATRMRATRTPHRVQILVTARPNASGLAEPDDDLFQTLRLEPLTPDLQSQFISKWCDINDIRGRARRAIRATFLSRTAEDQVAQLADNPMHLTILLFLINRKGEAVPASLTPLYTDYMGTLLDREVSRKQIDREQVPLIREITAFLGWHMHARIEADPTAGRMTRRDIETTLMLYFRVTGGTIHPVEDLLKATTDRFWALTSKVDGTFEFVVQPVREYFAAWFLAEWAGRDRPEPPRKQDILSRLIDRTYWLNVARFYAGFASPNEVGGLRYGLEETIAASRHPLQERAAAWGLLADGIFANSPLMQRDVARLMTGDLSVHLIAGQLGTSASFAALSRAAGGTQLADALMKDLQADPGGPLASVKTRILSDLTGLTQSGFLDWCAPRRSAAIGTADQSAWLTIGTVFGVPRLQGADADRLSLDSAGQCQAALSAGASPGTGTGASEQLLRAVLDGWCSDVTTSSSAEAGALLRAMRPQWYHQLPPGHRDGPPTRTGHRWLSEADRNTRPASWARLLQFSPRYEALKQAANPYGKGQKGTTEPWQNPARELARLHGPCWLAAEIAIAGAAAPATIGSGSADRDGEPFGEHTDYGTLVLQVHARPPGDWWEAMHARYTDSLSRRTWSLALLATADTDVVAAIADRIDACLRDLTGDEFGAVAASASRLGVMQAASRRLQPRVWDACTGLGARVKLLLAHFTASLPGYDPLAALADEDLQALASPDPAAWPIARAITARLLGWPSPVLVEALAGLGPAAAVDLPRKGTSSGAAAGAAVLEPDLANAILQAPARYPSSWVMAAEQSRSAASAEASMEQAAVIAGWAPKLPRL